MILYTFFSYPIDSHNYICVVEYVVSKKYLELLLINFCINCT